MLAPGGGLGAGGHSAKPLKSQTDLFLLLSEIEFQIPSSSRNFLDFRPPRSHPGSCP